MADDDKQVDIEVALRDTASQTLRTISREIDNISRKLIETGRKGTEAFGKIREEADKTGGGSKGAGAGVTDFSKGIKTLTGALAGPVGLAAAFYALGKSLASFAQQRVQLSLLTTDLGATSKLIGQIQQIMMRKGLDEDQAKGVVTSIFGQFQELRMSGLHSQMFDRLMKFNDPNFAEGLLKAAQSGNIDQAWKITADKFRHLLATGQTERARYLANVVLGQKLTTFTDLDKLSEGLIKVYQVNDEEARKAHRAAADLATKYRNIQRQAADGIITEISRVDQAIQDAAKNTGDLRTRYQGGYPSRTAPPPAGTTPPATPAPTPAPGKQSSLSGGDGDVLPSGARPVSGQVPAVFANVFKDVEQTEKESNRTLISIKDTLDSLTRDPTTGLPGSTLASLGPTGARAAGGQTGVGGTTAASGGRVTGGPSTGSTGALGGTVGRYQVDAYGGLTGKTLYDPMTGWLGGGLGGHSAKFGPGQHQGLDIMGKVGSPVHAIQEGVVIQAPQQGRGIDQTMVIRHPDGTYTRYLHQGWSPQTVVGGKVGGGQIVGTSGYRNAPHSHVEVWVGPPGGKGSRLVNLRAVMGYDPKNTPVGGTPRVGRGPGSGAPQVPTAAPQGTPVPSGVPQSARPADGKTVRASWFNDKVTASGKPASVPGIALPSRSTLGQWFYVRDENTGKEILTQQTDVGPAKWTKRGIDINAPLAKEFGYPSMKSFPTDTDFSYRPALDRANTAKGKGASRRDGNVKASVDFGAMKRVKEAGEIFVPLKTTSFAQGSTVHQSGVLPGDTDFSRWTG